MWRWLRLGLVLLVLLAFGAGSQPRLCPEMAAGQACWSHPCASSAGERLALAYMCHPEGLAHQAARGSWAPAAPQGEAPEGPIWAVSLPPWADLGPPRGLSPPPSRGRAAQAQAHLAVPLPPPRA